MEFWHFAKFQCDHFLRSLTARRKKNPTAKNLEQPLAATKKLDHGRARNFTETNMFNTLQEGPFANVKGN